MGRVSGWLWWSSASVSEGLVPRTQLKI